MPLLIRRIGQLTVKQCPEVQVTFHHFQEL